jgi:hypothetical protein
VIRRPAAALAVSLLSLVVLAAPAAAGGRGPTRPVASCVVAGSVVQATGLPTGEVVNFFVTDAAGTRGWVLGYTPDGTWSVAVPAPSGPTTYQFTSRTWGPNGTKYAVFASCAA